MKRAAEINFGFAPGSLDAAFRPNHAGTTVLRRTLLFVTPTSSVSAELLGAIERRFAWFSYQHVKRIEEAYQSFDHPVALILVEGGVANAGEQDFGRLRRFHPGATTVLVEGASDRPYSYSAFLDSSLFDGVVPNNLRVDHWLLIIELLLCGGRYFHAGLIQAPTSAKSGQIVISPGRDHRNGDGMTKLTHREIQIIALVSKGLQNKNIADRLKLSENTVKIHIHNIIRKLGVHNRTEAAARYHHQHDVAF